MRTTYDGAGRPLLIESRLAIGDGTHPGTVKGAAQYRYSIVPEEGARLARFEALNLSPRCSASAIWSDARGLKRTIFEDQQNFYPPESQLKWTGPISPTPYDRDPGKTRGYCDPIENIAESWATATRQAVINPGGQPSWVSYTYDPLQQLGSVDYPLDGTDRTQLSVRYDLLGRTMELQEPNSGCTSYAYDGLNLLRSEKGYAFGLKPGTECGTYSKVRNEKNYLYSGDRLMTMSYRSLEEQGAPEDQRDTVRFYYDRYPYAALFGEILETPRFVPNDQANQRFVDAVGRRCDNCIGQMTIVSDRTGARGFSYNELGLTGREIRSIVAPMHNVKHSEGKSEVYLPEIAFFEQENSYTAFGDPVSEKFSESAPMNPAYACLEAGVETCLARFTIGRKYAPDGAVAQVLFNGKPLISAAQDALGRPAVRWTSNGLATGYRYDPLDLRLNQMTTLAVAKRDSEAVPIQVNGYQYDGGGNVVGYFNDAWAARERYQSSFAFQYDAVSRLTKFGAKVRKLQRDLPQDMQSEGDYTYDLGHRFKTRRLTIVGNPSSVLRRQWLYTYRDDPREGPVHAPRSITFGVGEGRTNTDLFYDDIGRLTRIVQGESTGEGDKKPIPLLSSRAMTWDAEGKLIRVRGVAGESVAPADNSLREDYIYDSGGNRTLKINPCRAPQDKNKCAKEDEKLAVIYMTPFYARPYDKRGTVELSQGSLPVASLTPPADQGEDPLATYLYSDLPVGSMSASVTALGEASDADATLIARREYSPYGLELTADDLARPNREGVAPMSVFHGKELDRLTSFSSFGARYYSRDLAIWLKPDPMLTGDLGEGKTQNLFNSRSLSSYSIDYQNPVAFIDKNGNNPGICYSGVTQVYACSNIRSGNYLIDNTALGVVNQVLDAIPSIGNAGRDVLAGVGYILEPYQDEINALAAVPEIGPAIEFSWRRSHLSVGD